MNRFAFLLGLVIFSILSRLSVYGVSAYPYPVKITQPDGTTITIILKGDERVKWAETTDGYSIMRNSRGIYEYSTLDINNDMIPSGRAVKDQLARTGTDVQFLSTVKKGLRYSKGQIDMFKSMSKMFEKDRQKVFPTTGERKLICILIGFTDVPYSKTQSDFYNLFNQVGYQTGGATGSVKDFYLENSYNQFNLTVTLAGPFTASNTQAYYGANDGSGNDIRPRELVTEAINLADPTVNFVDFDNDSDGTVDGVYVIYAGYGEEAGGGVNCIWAHAWNIAPVVKDGKTINKYSCSPELRSNTGSTITAIGVICHEFGHVLGAPDFYDTNYSTGGSYTGTGNWDVMAQGSWNNSGITPAHHNPYSKITCYGWAGSTVLSSGAAVTLNKAELNSTSFYKINTITTNEYFLLENRQQTLFDAYIPGHGLIIYHVDGNYISTAGNMINATSHQGMYPICASATGNPPTVYGTINSTGLPFPGSTAKTSFSDQTTPNMMSWAGSPTNMILSGILENATTKIISFALSLNTMPSCVTLPATNITSTGATLNGQVNANGLNTTVTFEYGTTTSYGSTVNATPNTAIGSGSTSVSATLTGLTPNTNYNFRVKAVSSGGTAYGTNMATLEFLMNNNPVTTCSGKFYDSGGSTGNYLNNENITKTFSPIAAGNKLKFTFTSFDLESNFDFLYVYDGPSTSSPQFPGSPFSGATSPGTITASSTNSTGAVTFRYTSDYSVTHTGWAADINCITVCTPPTIQASSFQSYSVTDTTISIGWVRGNGNSVLLVAHRNSTVDANPLNGINYTANSRFGSGTEIGAGNFVVYNGTGTSVNITGLTRCSEYYFSLCEYSSSYCYKVPPLTGHSGNTAPVITQHPSNQFVTVLNPGIFSITATGTALTYQWQVNTGTGSFTNLMNNAPYSGVTTNSLNISSVTANMNHYFYRCVVSGTGSCTTISNPASICIIPAIPLIDTIIQPNCLVTTGSVHLSGLPSTGGWTVTRNPGGATVSGTGNSLILTGLLPGTYSFTVTAGECTSSSTTNITIDPVPTILSAPNNPIASTITQTAGTLTWNRVPSATWYRLDVATNNSFTEFVTGYNNLDVGNVSSKAVTGLTANTTYYFRVRAYNLCLNSANSNVTQFTTLPNPPPAPVGDIATNITQTSFTARWKSSVNATGYMLDIDTDSTFNSNNGLSTKLSGYSRKDVGNVLTHGASGLTEDTRYYYRLIAYNAGGESSYSNTISFKTLRYAPLYPSLKQATSIIQTGFIVNWNPSIKTDGYRIDVATDNSFANLVPSFNNRDLGNVTSLVVTGLSDYTRYFYRVRSYNNGGTSLDNPAPGTLMTLTKPPTVPSGITATSCNNQITVTWRKNSDPNGYFSKYRIYAALTSDPTTKVDSATVGIADTIKVLSGFVNNQTYFVRVTAVNFDGPESSFSSQASAKVKTGVIPRVKTKFNEILICFNVGDSIKKFQWYKDGSALSKGNIQYYITNKSAGNYYIETTDLNGCRNISKPISMSGSKSISVYPNPASESFTITLNDITFYDAKITILNSAGLKVSEFRVEDSSDKKLREIPAGYLMNGIYNVQVSLDNGEIYNSKIVIVK